MGSLRLSPDQRRGYETYLEGRALELAIKQGRKELEDQWKSLRRGWYLGDEGFLKKLKGKLGELVEGLKRESHSGEARRLHDVAEAEKLLEEGLKRLKVTEGELQKGSKSAPEKAVLAWWLRRNTSVPLKWVAQRLAMGHYTRVTQSVSRLQRGKVRKLRALQKLLLTAHK